MFKQEWYRMFSRKTTLAALAVALSFTFLNGLSYLWGEGTIDGGNVYMREEAVAKDKEIARRYAGPLTEEVVRAIWEEYGPPVNCADRYTTWDHLYILAQEGGNDNYCSRFVATWFGEEVRGEDGRITYVLPEDLSGNPYLSGEYIFGYVGNGWNAFGSNAFTMGYILTGLVIVTALSPMFSEDYVCRTADIFLPTTRGRMVLWWIRTASGCCFATLVYWLVCGMVFLQEWIIYGSESLEVSCGLAGLSKFPPKAFMPMGRAVTILYLAGWFSVMALALLVQAVSAGSRQNFSSLVKAAAVYMGPLAILKLVLDVLPESRLNALLHYICYSMPLSYPCMFLEAPAGGMEVLVTAIALVTALCGAILGACSYCRHQVR